MSLSFFIYFLFFFLFVVICVDSFFFWSHIFHLFQLRHIYNLYYFTGFFYIILFYQFSFKKTMLINENSCNVPEWVKIKRSRPNKNITQTNLTSDGFDPLVILSLLFYFIILFPISHNYFIKKNQSNKKKT
jgi:hypothetical protein